MIAGCELRDGEAAWVAPLYDGLLADMLLPREPSGYEVAFLVRELGIPIR